MSKGTLMRTSHPVKAVACALVVLGVGGVAAGQGPPPAPSGAGRDALSTRLVRFADRLKGASSYRVTVAESWTTEGTSKPERGATRYDLAVERPGKFAIRVEPGGEPRPVLEVVCAGDAVVSSLAKPEP